MSLKDGYAITQPHVDTLYENKYPWVVTIAKKKYSDLFQKQVFVAVNFEFISIAKYIDKISIGQRGYCYIIDSKGGIVYHPQQQMLFPASKREYRRSFRNDGRRSQGRRQYLHGFVP